MSVQAQLTDALTRAVPFVGIMLVWIVVMLVIYGGFTLVWPDIPEAEPWIFLGVYLFPFAGFLGHTLQQALAES